MTPLDETKYFVQPADGNPPSETAPLTERNCKVTPLIDCAAYNAELEAALATVGTGPDAASNAGHFILIANWWLGLRGGRYQPTPSIFSSFGPQVIGSRPYTLDPPADTKVLSEILKEKADLGVDVRVLAWVSFAVMDSAIAQKSGAGSIARVNAMTMESVKDLRAHASLAKKVTLNVISHTAGAVHNKLVVIGNGTDAVGFTGGLDFEMTRFAHPGHPDTEFWHDVVAKVQGPTVQEIFHHFGRMWTENLSRPVRKFRYAGKDMPSYVPGTPPLPVPALTLAPTGADHRVQVLHTVPQFNYKWLNCLPENQPISFAPQGTFQYKLALRKALKAAESFIYIEDQSFWSQEILGWVNYALKNQPSLKVILLFPGGADPNDAALDDAPYLTQSINHGLLDGLTAAQRDRVRLFRRFGDWVQAFSDEGLPIVLPVVDVADTGADALVTTGVTLDKAMRANATAGKHFRLVSAADPTQYFAVLGNPAIAAGAPLVLRVEKTGGVPPSVGTYPLIAKQGMTVHAKTAIVDDQWAVIGSGNCMRRSLYTDLEHGVAFMAEDGTIPDYRSRLWADHFRHPTAADFVPLDGALHAWEPSWGSPGAAPARPPELLEPIPIPLTEVAFTSSTRGRYDMYMDLDSRESWGGIFP